MPNVALSPEIIALDKRFFEIMNTIADHAREERGDLDTVDKVIEAMTIYMKSRRVPTTNDKEQAMDYETFRKNLNGLVSEFLENSGDPAEAADLLREIADEVFEEEEE
jgi:hypothetical protein